MLYVPSCIAPSQSQATSTWLTSRPLGGIERGKKPYDSDDWKQWLANKKKPARPAPMPNRVLDETELTCLRLSSSSSRSPGSLAGRTDQQT